jgi:hypothetical protein
MKAALNSLGFILMRCMASQTEAIENGYLNAIDVPLRQAAQAFQRYREDESIKDASDVIDQTARAIEQWRVFEADKDKHPNRKSKGFKE